MPLKTKPPEPVYKPFVIFAHHDEVDILRLLVLQRTEPFVVKFHRPQVDVLLEFETKAQQDAFLQNPRLDVWMSDGAEQDGREFTQFLDDTIGQRFVGSQIALAAEIVAGVIEFDREIFRRRHPGL